MVRPCFGVHLTSSVRTDSLRPTTCNHKGDTSSIPDNYDTLIRTAASEELVFLNVESSQLAIAIGSV